MKSVSILYALLLSAPVFAADPAPVNPHATPANPHAMPATPHAGMQTNQPMLSQTGKVLSTISVPGFTYVEVSQGKKTLWLAAATSPVKKGDVVRFDDGLVMTDFYSKTLKRSFPSIVFVNTLVIDNAKK